MAGLKVLQSLSSSPFIKLICAQELAAAEGLDRVTRELAEEAAQVLG